MEFSTKSITLMGAVLLTGLSAGLFYAWACSVIPGTKRVSDITYLETMQSINTTILNPVFFASFIGSLLLLTVSSFQLYSTGVPFGFTISATLSYLIGTFLVTALGNVPLNNALEVLNLKELSSSELSVFRQYYEVKWNRFHNIRTLFSIVSFSLSVLTLYTYSKSVH